MVPALIPVYNVAPLLPALLPAVRAHLPQVLFVDDGSTDGTTEILRSSGLPYVSHERNRGKGTALHTGFLELLKDPVVTGVLTLDGDGQHDPAEAVTFLVAHAARPEAFLVGNRWSEDHPGPWPRRIANNVSSALIRAIAHAKIADSQCGYRLYPRSYLEPILTVLEPGRFETETILLLLAGRLRVPIENVAIRSFYTDDTIRLSKYRALEDTFLIGRALLRAATHPLPA